MLCLKSMALGDTLDVQREKRWPNQTGSGTKVVFDPYQEDEFSDTEGDRLLGEPHRKEPLLDELELGGREHWARLAVGERRYSSWSPQIAVVSVEWRRSHRCTARCHPGRVCGEGARGVRELQMK